MQDHEYSAYELFDSLTPYEVAVLIFTSPRVVESRPNEGEVVTLTGKDAYLWAGMIAHAIVRHPEWSVSYVTGLCQRALMTVTWNLAAPRHDRRHAFDDAPNRLNFDVIDAFAREAGLTEERQVVAQLTADAVQSLVWSGYIEDPFKKKIGSVVIALMLNVPIGFTSHGPRTFDINALTWKYSQQSSGAVVKRDFHVKVKEVCGFVIKEAIPAIVKAADELASAESTQAADPRKIQAELARLGYYTGPIDGDVGPKTRSALRKFQRENGLPDTGWPDPATSKKLE